MTQLTIIPHSLGDYPGLPLAGEVHLWRTDLDESLGDISVLSRMLSPPEQARARRFAFEKHRRRFIVAKAWSRSVLGLYLSREPRDVPLTVDTRGKPHIAAAANHADLRFNLSHSGRYALLAVTVNQNVGVDVQDPIPYDFLSAVAKRLLTPGELACIHDLAPTARALALAEIWTRKEAVAKALGTGLTSQVFSYTVGPSAWGMVCCGGRLWVCSLPAYNWLAGAVAVQQDLWIPNARHSAHPSRRI
jgi:4'-phosphopantetheinyl transferase